MSFPISARPSTLNASFSPRTSGESTDRPSTDSGSETNNQASNARTRRQSDQAPSVRASINPAEVSPLQRERPGFKPIDVRAGGTNNSNNSQENAGQGKEADSKPGEGTKETVLPGRANDAESPSGEELSRREKQKVEKLKRKDQKVRKHEQAHLSAGGRYVRGGLDLNYKRGPDGERYAVGGSVSLDAGRGNSPQKTIQKMRQVRAAALAPAQPSPKDLQVAQSASKKASKARQKLSEQQQEELQQTRKKIEQQTSSESGESNGSREEAKARQIPVSGQSDVERSGEGNETDRNQRSKTPTNQSSPASFREVGEGSNSPDIEKTPPSDGPEIEKLEGTSTVELEERQQVSAPDEAFEDAVGTGQKNTVTLGNNFEATA